MSNKKPPEPGTVKDPELGIPGDAEELPFNDADEEHESRVNDPVYDEEEEEDDGAR